MEQHTSGNLISLVVNGLAVKAYKSEYPPSTSLLEYLRSSGLSTGTKGCCYQGGCGVCVVTVTSTHPLTADVKHQSVNSCCLLLYSCDGLEITTVEGLGNVKVGLHSIQDRLSKFDGAQCGYCTPGQIMNMYGLLKQNPKPSAEQVEDAFDTTICRCTGYRPILDAMKSFAVDTSGDLLDIEELGVRKCCGQKDELQCQVASRGVDTARSVQSKWLSPTSLAQLYRLLTHAQHKKDNYRLVFGNTGFGVYEDLGVWKYPVVIDIHKVKELFVSDMTSTSHVTLGANLTIADLINTFEMTEDFKNLSKHLKLVASNTIRNSGSWSGNLMVKYFHPLFASDIFTIFQTVGARLNIGSENSVEQVTLPEFCNMEMKGKVILSVKLPRLKDRTVVTYRTSHRLQSCEASVVSGFNFTLDKDFVCLPQPTIVLQLSGNKVIHGETTEHYLEGKKLSDTNVCKDAVKILSEELMKFTKDSQNKEYLVSLAVSHFYKFVLNTCKTKLPKKFESGGSVLERDVMTGVQDLGTTFPENYPASSAVMKLTAPRLTTGEIKFLDDIPPCSGQVYAVPVLTSLANGYIDSIDTSIALSLPGVVCFLQATDIPGKNNWRPKGWYKPGEEQELLCSGKVLYAGQPLGVIVAYNETVAKEAVSKVKVTYKDVQPAITDLKEAVRRKRFHKEPRVFTAGDVKAAMEGATHVLSGTVCCGDQYQFHLENQAAICSPTDVGGIVAKVTSQWLDFTQGALAQVLDLPESQVAVEVTRLGGGFGGKMFYSAQVAGMCALAATKTKRTTKLTLDLNTNMQMQGSRTAYQFDYKVAFDKTGKLCGIDITAYSDTGAVWVGAIDAEEAVELFIDNCYSCPNWSLKAFCCHTDRPPSTACRAPGSSNAIFAMESIMDHIASFLNMDHLAIRQRNLFTEGQKTMQGMLLEHCLISDVVAQLKKEARYAERQQEIQKFNKNNRWKKRGLHVMPSMYSMLLAEMLCYNTTVSICHGDGSVVITHGGVDMGQGINTKVIQCCALKLGVPMEKIVVSPSSTVISPNSWFAGASVTSELICMDVLKCCEELTARMKTVKDKLGEDVEWTALVTQCFSECIDLTAYYRSGKDNRNVNNYSCYSACCTEVEVDVLTGQYQMRQVDYLCDAGVSLNPRLDLGQLEGGFMMGCGLFLLESMTFEPDTGKALSTGTWTYKPPMAKDLPVKFNAKFLRNAPNPKGVLGSKAVGETPVASGACPLFALKRAIEAARQEIGLTDTFVLDAPATIQRVHSACSTQISHMTLR